MGATIRIGNVAGRFSEGVEERGRSRRLSEAAAGAERSADRFRRVARAAFHLLRRAPLRAVLAGADLILRDRLVRAAALPDPLQALDRPQGLCGLAHDLSPASIWQAYENGLVLRAPAGPATWWAPETRSLRLPQAHEAGPVACHFDRDREGAIARAALGMGRRDPLAAQSPDLIQAWRRLASRNLLHTFEGPDHAGHGLSVGRLFVLTGLHAETAAARDGALAALESELFRRGYAWLDVTLADPQAHAPGTLAFSREAYANLLASNPDGERPVRWDNLRMR